jgi:DNA-binding response OmpR family regulator
MAPSSLPSSLPVLRRRIVLVVEADRRVRLFLERALRQTEAVVLGVEHAEAAFTALTVVMPDLIWWIWCCRA